MAIEINGIELTHVHKITSIEGGGHIRHKVPGLAGEISQDTGRDSLQLCIDGIFYGDKKADDLKSLREIFLKREPVEFLAQITGQAYAAKVIVESMQVMESGGHPDQYTYQIIVTEYIEPPASAAVATDAVNAAVAVEAMQIMDVMELPDMLALGSIPEISNPLEPLKGALTTVQEASNAFLGASSGLKILLGENQNI
jgi:hypothetical protein